MRILIIFISDSMRQHLLPNIIHFKKYMYELSKYHEIDYAGISTIDDFHHYEEYITFKYKMITPKRQLSKMVDFINTYKDEMKYDWYVKMRPENYLMQQLCFHNLCKDSMNARARYYEGSKKILFGSSVEPDKVWPYPHTYNTEYENVVLDDIIYFFHQNIIDLGTFQDLSLTGEELQCERFHTNIWKSKNIGLNVIGIFCLTDYRNGRCDSPGHIFTQP